MDDNIWGFILFAIIAAVSGLVKLVEKRKEDAQRHERGTRRSVDELPEATRRMLYGDEGPPVARRRGEVPPPPVAVPRRQAPPQAPPRRPVPPRQEGIPTAVPQRRDVPPQRTAPAPPRRMATPPQRPTPARQAHRTLQENWARAQRNLDSQRAAAQQRPPQPPETRSQPAPPPPAAPQRRARGRRASIQELLHHPKTLRTSIILHEVLSKPKAFR